MSKPPTTVPSFLRIGQLAERSGLSAKALRLYEQRGLLKPSTHSEAGYRLYGPEALQRLMQVVLLKRSGFTLAQIGSLLARNAKPAAQLLASHIAKLERELDERAKALAALRRVARRVDSASTLDLNQLLESIHMGHSLKLDLSTDERNLVQQRAALIGDNLQTLRDAYPDLIAAMRASMDAGTPATDPAVIGLARRYRALAPKLPEVDPAMRTRLVDAVAGRADVMAANGLDEDLLRYIVAAVAAAKAAEAQGRA